ncbi:MAG: M4 family metallopeptidase, partial [Verrucomicrobiota bacterium]|nr:M4 family metallopeptidase [Verrucomicrobiota bacterium]
MSRTFRRLVITSLCVLFSAPGLAIDDPGRQAPPPLPERGARASARAPTADQRRAEVQARANGIKVEWDTKAGVPQSIRGKDLGARGAFSGGKGLKPAGRSHAEDAIAVLDNLSRFFGIRDAAREFMVRRTDADKLGFRHVRLEQTHGGLRVVGGELIVHFNKKNEAYQVNGRHVAVIDVPVEAKVTAEAAVAVARKELASFSPGAAELTAAAALVVYALEGDPCLAYDFTLAQLAVPARWRYWVDAITGEVIGRYNDIQHVATPTTNGAPAVITGSVLVGEGGAPTAVTGWFENGNSLYYLRSTNCHWRLYNVAAAGWPDAATYAHRNASDWGTSDRAEVSLASAFDKIARYWRERHARDGFNGSGILARVNVHEGTNYVNAYYDGFDFHFGDGDNLTASPLGVLDVAAHEFTHGVIKYSAGLIYSRESGALNESFSDIFGACVEFYAQPDGRTNYPAAPPGVADWLMGEDCWLSSTALRDLRNPRNAATVGAGNEQPSRYKGAHWHTGPGDNGGVHRNCGVQNFFFYLLSEGGSGDNDGIAYDVTGIGLANAEQVAYRALTVYCVPATDYKAARIAWISAAEDLNPGWVGAVAAAWDACDVSPVTITPDAGASFRGAEGGPFTPAARTYTLANTDPTPVGWVAVLSAPWLTASPGGGSIPARGSTDVRISVNGEATMLVAGRYTATVGFSNTVNGAVVTRAVSLWVGAPDYFTEIFEAADNDLDGMTLTFTPNGTASYYLLCRAVATNFPSDPAGGAVLALTDDGSGNVVLSGDAAVSLYGTNYTSFFVGANGYITLGTGDTAFIESLNAHFALPRVAALFDDLNPEAGGQVSWKQWTDRVAVTWLNVPEFVQAGSNSFQIELFFDGRIRITWLDLAATDGLAGLSRGGGTPLDFVETDLSACNLSPPPDDLNVLTFGNLVGSGLQAGPFTPAGKTYTLTNSGSSSVSWAATPSEAWLSTTPASGTLPAGQKTDVTVGWGAAANSMLPGVYNGSVAFSNTATGVAHTRSAQLTVRVHPGEIEVFDTIAPFNDLTVAFGDVIIGLSRTESVTVTNTDPTWPLTVSNISVRGVSPFAATHIPAFTGTIERVNDVVSFGPAPGGAAAVRAAAGASAAPSTVPCYGLDLQGRKLVSFSSATPASLTEIGNIPRSLYACDFLNGDFTKLYALDAGNNMLLTINTATAARTIVGPCAPASGHTWTGLAGTPDGTLYAASTDNTMSKLYQINPATGAATFIGNIGDIDNPLIIIAIAVNARGRMYGVDIVNDNLVAINPATGAGTIVGSLGVNANYAQGMDFDEDNDILYWAAHVVGVGPQLRVIDTASGASELVGNFPAGTRIEMAVANGGSGFKLMDPPALPYSLGPGEALTLDILYAPLAM